MNNRKEDAKASLEEIAKTIIDSGAVEIRDVDNGQEPFLYTTGNWGPGYVMIKGLVGQRKVMKFLTKQLAHRVAPLYRKAFDFIEGNVTGGMIPGWQLTDDVESVLGLEKGSIPYCYLRGSRKVAGHSELITGDRKNPHIQEGMKALIVEELVNFAGTTTNAAKVYRKVGYPVSHATCILSYDHQESNRLLEETDVTLVPLITLPQLLDASEKEGYIQKMSIDSYRSFLSDPVKWQLDRGLAIPEASAEKAIERNYNMKKLTTEEAISKGVPTEKLKEGLVYYFKE